MNAKIIFGTAMLCGLVWWIANSGDVVYALVLLAGSLGIGVLRLDQQVISLSNEVENLRRKIQEDEFDVHL